MKPRLSALSIVCLFAACSKSPAPVAATAGVTPAAPETTVTAKPAEAVGVDWQTGDVDAAFEKAKAENKPLFLYWGAAWCPPCNEVKAKIFSRADFVERSRAFVAVYLDGDTPSAQKYGARFKVNGYPTTIVFKPDGGEVTRLPGELDAQRYLQLLDIGLNANRGVKEAMEAALKPEAVITPEEWRLLAHYSWETGDGVMLPKDQLAPTVRKLADACPASQSDSKLRLNLKASSLAATAGKVKPGSGPVAAREQVMQTLADAKAARENLDVFIYDGDQLAAYLTKPRSPERAALVAALGKALNAFNADASVSTTFQVEAIGAKVALAKLDLPKAARLPPALLDELRAAVKRADAAAESPYERQSVINAAAGALGRAGLLDESDVLLKAELSRSHQPYYFMLDLASNAQERGDKAGALDWYAKAYAAAEGPATRLQWGVFYLEGLTELAPDDDAGIVKIADGILAEVEAKPEFFYDRNLRYLHRLGTALKDWNAKAKHAASYAALKGKVDTLCGRLPAEAPERQSCENIVGGSAAGVT